MAGSLNKYYHIKQQQQLAIISMLPKVVVLFITYNGGCMHCDIALSQLK